jgi:hypothetical protein
MWGWMKTWVVLPWGSASKSNTFYLLRLNPTLREIWGLADDVTLAQTIREGWEAEEIAPQEMLRLSAEQRQALDLPPDDEIWHRVEGGFLEESEGNLKKIAKLLLDEWEVVRERELAAHRAVVNGVDALPTQLWGHPINPRAPYDAYIVVFDAYSKALTDLAKTVDYSPPRQRRDMNLQQYQNLPYEDLLMMGEFVSVTRNNLQVEIDELGQRWEDLGVVSDVAEFIGSVLFEPLDYVLTAGEIYRDWQDDGQIGWSSILQGALTLLPGVPNFLRYMDEALPLIRPLLELEGQQLLRAGSDYWEMLPPDMRAEAMRLVRNWGQGPNTPGQTLGLADDAAAATGDDALEAAGNLTPSRTQPSMSPDPSRLPSGTPPTVTGSPDTRQGLTRQNEAAEVLARKGYNVEHLAETPSVTSPDLRIEGEIFDVYSPITDDVSSIRDSISKKVKRKQTERVVLNMDGTSASLEDLGAYLKTHPITGLKEIIVVRDGEVIPFWPPATSQ